MKLWVQYNFTRFQSCRESTWATSGNNQYVYLLDGTML